MNKNSVYLSLNFFNADTKEEVEYPIKSLLMEISNSNSAYLKEFYTEKISTIFPSNSRAALRIEDNSDFPEQTHNFFVGESNMVKNIYVEPKKNTYSTLSGTVTFGQTPIPGVLVSLKDVANNTLRDTISNSRGEYVFSNIPDGAYTVSALATDFISPDPAGITISYQSDSSYTHNIPLTPKTTSSTLHGTITNQAGAGIAGAKLSITSSDTSLTVYTSGLGVYSASGLPSGTYTVAAVAEGYFSSRNNSIEIGDPAEYTLNIALTAHSRLDCYVKDQDNKPVAGATLTLKRKSTHNTWTELSNNKGMRYFGSLHAGAYQLTVEALGYQTLTIDSIPIEAASTQKQTIRLKLFRTDLPVKVVRAGTTIPVSGATVSTVLNGDVLSGTCNSKGITTIQGLPSGSYDIRVMANGYVEKIVNIRVDAMAAKQNTRVIELIPHAINTTLIGEVRDASNNALISSPKVTLYLNGTAIAESQLLSKGKYRINVEQMGTYTLIATAEGYLPSPEIGLSVNSSTGAEIKRNFLLEKNPDNTQKQKVRIYGNVNDYYNNQPLALVNIIVKPDDGSNRVLTTKSTNKDGDYEILLDNGRYKLDIVKKSYKSKSTEITANASNNPEQQHNFGLYPYPDLSGLVRKIIPLAGNTAKVAVQGASMYLYKGTNVNAAPYLSTTSQKNGKYLLADLEQDQQYTLVVEAEGCENYQKIFTLKDFVFQTHVYEMNIDLKPIPSFIASVKNSDGADIPNALVTVSGTEIGFRPCDQDESDGKHKLYLPLPNGTYKATAVAIDYGEKSKSFEINNSNPTANLNFSFTQSSRQSMSVTSFPNPSSQEVTIKINLPEAGNFTLEAFSQNGDIEVIEAGYKEAGEYSIQWDPNGKLGYYFIRLISPVNGVQTARTITAFRI